MNEFAIDTSAPTPMSVMPAASASDVCANTISTTPASASASGRPYRTKPSTPTW